MLQKNPVPGFPECEPLLNIELFIFVEIKKLMGMPARAHAPKTRAPVFAPVFLPLLLKSEKGARAPVFPHAGLFTTAFEIQKKARFKQ